MKKIHYAGWLGSAALSVLCFSWYTLHNVKNISLYDDLIKKTSVDLVISDLNLQQFDQFGHEQHSLHSPKVERFPLNKKHMLQDPQLHLTQDHESSWDISAKQALVVRNNQKIIFKQNVVLSKNGGNLLSGEKSSDKVVMHADEMIFDQATHAGVYQGHVLIEQGTTYVKADNANIQLTKQNKLQSLVLKGHKKNQVHYFSDDKQKIIHAYADLMQYFPDRHLMRFVGNARLMQDDNYFTAPMIIYDTKSQHVMSASQGVARTTILIHPEGLKQLN